MIKNFTCLLLASLFITYTAQGQDYSPKREFRGVWVATVQNIDWPSKKGLNSDRQKQELTNIFDEHQKSGMNAIMFQIRPSADALYAKSSEEWSMFLSGKQGVAPSPLYDPLEFAIQEAHLRGMELHAWFNPYRATNDLIDANTSQRHITRTKPEWFFTYAGKKYFNPGIPEVRQYIVSIIMNVVRNYDIDGVHFDDYFYPYPGKEILPDSLAYAAYGSNKFPSIEDWRRNNVDMLIKELNDSIHTEKKFVKFGISPFGIWRNKKDDALGSETNGLSGYSALYADARKWLSEGWIDYINPQVYFPFKYPAAAYEKLVDWWSNNAYGRHIYIGQGVYRATEQRDGWKQKNQLPEQVRYLRKNPRVQGSVYFSSKSLTNNLAGFQDSLRQDLYRSKALIPTMIWLDAIPPQSPLKLAVKRSKGSNELTWESPLPVRDNEPAYGYVVYRFETGEEIDINNPDKIRNISFDSSKRSFLDKDTRKRARYTYVVTTLDRLKNESLPSNDIKVKSK